MAKKKLPEKKTKKPEPARQEASKESPAPKTAKAAGKAGGKGAKAPKGKTFEEGEDDDLTLELDGASGGEEDAVLAEFEAETEVEEDDDVDDTDTDSDTDGDDVEVAASGEDDEDVILTDAEGNRYCRVRDCDQISTVDGYCRYHYLLLWKKIQVRKKILTDGKLEYYIIELTARYPDKFLELIRRDLRTQKDFLSAIQELEIDESGLDNDFEEEDTQFIDEVRGLGTGTEGESVEDDF